jgi:hypothetical protein
LFKFLDRLVISPSRSSHATPRLPQKNKGHGGYLGGPVQGERHPVPSTDLDPWPLICMSAMSEVGHTSTLRHLYFLSAERCDAAVRLKMRCVVIDGDEICQRCKKANPQDEQCLFQVCCDDDSIQTSCVLTSSNRRRPRGERDLPGMSQNDPGVMFWCTL